MIAPPTTTNIHDLLLAMLATALGGDPAYWRELLGPVGAAPIWENPKSNWTVSTTATGEDLYAIEYAVQCVRAQHPYVEL